MCAEIAPTEKQSKIFEKMFILKYTIKTGVFSRFFLLFCLPLKIGVFSRFFLLFCLPLKIGVFFLKKWLCTEGAYILLISSYLTPKKKTDSIVFVKGIFGYLLMAPLKVDSYNYYVPTSIRLIRGLST
jgi:hypothetical protein